MSREEWRALLGPVVATLAEADRTAVLAFIAEDRPLEALDYLADRERVLGAVEPAIKRTGKLTDAVGGVVAASVAGYLTARLARAAKQQPDQVAAWYSRQRLDGFTRDLAVHASERTKVAEAEAEGVPTMRWVTGAGDTCDYCRAMNGLIVRTGGRFMRKGTPIWPPGASRPLVPRISKKNPPMHPGCNCRIEPA